MQHAPQIITQRTKSGLEVWVSQDALMRFCPSLSDGYLRRIRCGNKNGEISAWHFTQSHGTYYYDYNSIPNKKPAMYASMLPTREELLELANKPVITNDTTLEIEAKQFIAANFVKYLHYYSKQCQPQQAINLARACAMLEWMLKHIDDVSLDLGKMDFFKRAGEIIGSLEIKYLPEAYRNLKYKVLDILSGNASIVESVYLPRAGNDYAASHREDLEVLSWIYELRESGKNYTNAFIVRKVQAECEKVGKPMPSERWIGEILETKEAKFLTAATRFGSKSKYGNPYKASIPTANALFAGDCWEMDATRVNMVPHAGKGGKASYLFIIAVRDVYSGNAVGINFDTSENRWSVTQALSNAVKNTGYLPLELRIDRFPGHNSEEVQSLFKTLEMLGVRVTITHKSTGKQRLERWFGSLQHLAFQESPFYYGEGIMSNRASAHRSYEYMQVAKKEAKARGWDFTQTVNEATKCLDQWLNTPYSKWSKKYKHIALSPVQMHEQSQKPNVIECNEAKHAFLFGLKKTLKIRNMGLIETEINKERFIYQITDFEIVKRYEKVICCYDVADLSKVHLYAPGEAAIKIYLGMAQEFTPPQLYGTEPEYGKLAKIKALYSEFEQKRAESLEYKKVANGSWQPTAQEAVAYPLMANKQVQEEAESEITNQYFGFDEGEDLNVDATHQL